ncbi:MAG: NfeD family protein [Desulfobulbaceae bacterium]|nr:NfeD family protein [Desulfobulbaceae bacterium]
MNLPYPILFWFITGAILFILEMFSPTFILFFFAIGAWLAALTAWLAPLALTGQLAVFLAGSLISLFLLRRALRDVFHGDTTQDAATIRQTAADEAQAEVIEAIRPPLEGRIKFQGSFWRAQSDTPVECGEIVRIVSQDSLVMRVRSLHTIQSNTEGK